MLQPLPDHDEETIPPAAKSQRPRGLLPQALEELQASLEELRVAEEEMRVQNEELSLSRLRLEAERQRYLDLFEFAPDGYLVTSQDGTILEANRAASQLVGISPRFLKKRNFSSLVALPALGEFQSRLKTLTQSGGFGEWEVPLRRRPSGQFHAAITAALYGGVLGQSPTLRWLVRDISGRVQAEEERMARIRAEAAQAEAEEVGRRTSEILEIITDMHLALDAEWRILSMNASAARLIQTGGKDPAALIGQVFWEAYPTSLGTEFETETLRAVAEGRTVEFEAHSQALNRWLHVRVFPLASGVSVYASDVTERHQADIALRAAYDRERRIAGTFQEILLHTPPPEAYPGLAIETFYEAASEEATVGGDFSDVFTYDSGKIVLVIGDVSGKGLGAASLIAEVKYALRAIFRDCFRPTQALARLNDFICEAQRQGDLGSDHLVALSLAAVDPDTGNVSCLTAGSEPILLLRADGTAESVATNGLLLGVQADMEYAMQETRIEPGDTLLLVTDGITEARRDGQFFGFEALQQQAVQRLPTETLRGLGETVLASVRDWAGGAFQDDVCLLLARCVD